MELAVGTAVSLSPESAQFAFEKQLEVTFSDDSGLAESSETVLAELVADRRLSCLLGLQSAMADLASGWSLHSTWKWWPLPHRVHFPEL